VKDPRWAGVADGTEPQPDTAPLRATDLARPVETSGIAPLACGKAPQDAAFRVPEKARPASPKQFSRPRFRVPQSPAPLGNVACLSLCPCSCSRAEPAPAPPHEPLAHTAHESAFGRFKTHLRRMSDANSDNSKIAAGLQGRREASSDRCLNWPLRQLCRLSHQSNALYFAHACR
jgi:hypothetical protein